MFLTYTKTSTPITISVSSAGLPSDSRYDYIVERPSGRRFLFFEMLHDDLPAVSGSFLLSVNGHSHHCLYFLTFWSSIRVSNNIPFTSSVMLDEKKFFNYRTTDPVYDRMVSLNVTITPFSKEFVSCVSGLSLFASSKYHYPNEFNADHGGKGIQFVSIGEEDLLTGRMYFGVEGTTASCTFVIQSEVIYNCEAETTCSGNGECDLDGICSCYEDPKRGFWTGGNCDKCHPSYTGHNCTTVICSPEVTCNGNGVCNDEGQCDCFSDDDRGFWSGDRCIFCISGYSGSECKTNDVQPESPLLMYIVLALCGVLLGAIGQNIYFSVRSSSSYNSGTLNLSELKHPLLQESKGPL
ncbi:hypothetical protein GEMRC1_013143 [Eukaryota sp. GEM-RC1]